jgi:hypothetical protein
MCTIRSSRRRAGRPSICRHGQGLHLTGRLRRRLHHRSAPPEATDKQTFVTSIEAGIETARAAAGDRDIAIMGGGVVTAALRAGLLDEVILPDGGAI